MTIVAVLDADRPQPYYTIRFSNGEMGHAGRHNLLSDEDVANQMVFASGTILTPPLADRTQPPSPVGS